MIDKNPKTVFQLDSPFTSVQWPQISSQNQETILELLLTLLSPIGHYRSNHVTSSKGKRTKKRKRREAKAEGAPSTSVPPSPEISSFLTVGLGSITRSLEFSSQISKSKTPAVDMSNDPKSTNSAPADDANDPPMHGHFAAIFVCRPSQPSVLHDHLPQLVTTSSLAHPEFPATRLVELSKDSDARLCKALGIPRVSFIGILEGAPHSKSLVDLVRQCVPEIDIPWLQQVKESKYLPVKINTIETSTVVKKY